MISNGTTLLLNFIQCPYKALLAQRQEPAHPGEYHHLANRQHDVYSEKALNGLIAQYDARQILRAPSSLSRSIRKHPSLILQATCHLAGHEITLPPIEANYSQDDDSRSLTPIFFSNLNKVGDGDKLIACVFCLVIAERTSHFVQRAKIVYGNGFETRCVALRGKNGATRMAAAARYVLDAFVKLMIDVAPPPTLELNSHLVHAGPESGPRRYSARTGVGCGLLVLREQRI